MKTFYLTFGQQSPARNGWLEVYACDYFTAREMVVNMYGMNWADLYEADKFRAEHFPAGKIGELGAKE